MVLRAKLGICAAAVAAAVVGATVLADGGSATAPLRGDTQACTLIGCESGVFARVSAIRRELPDSDRIRFCVNSKCRTFDQPVDFVSVRTGIRAERRVTVRMRVMQDGEPVHRDRIRVRLRKSRPNGPGCPPTCFSCGLRVDRETLELVKPRR